MERITNVEGVTYSKPNKMPTCHLRNLILIKKGGSVRLRNVFHKDLVLL